PSARLCGTAGPDPSLPLCVMSEKRVCGATALGRLLIARPKRPSMRHFGCDGVTLVADLLRMAEWRGRPGECRSGGLSLGEAPWHGRRYIPESIWPSSSKHST